MHDCRKIEERLMDLVFNELSQDERLQTLNEVESCEPCRAEYLSFRKTLSTFDEAAASMMPEENYWHTYEARLRAKLAAPERPNLRQRLLEAVRILTTQPAWAMSLAALLLIALLMWALLTQTNYQPQPTQATQENPAVITPESIGKEKAPIAQSSGKEDKKEKSLQQEPDHLHKKPSFRHQKNALPVTVQTAKQEKEYTNQRQTPFPFVATNAEQMSASLSLVDDETLKHFEKAQIFLRAFRNLYAAENGSAFEIADDKQRSRTLLFKNVLLRREAEAKGNLPVKQVLNDLEPLLIDIANLPGKATQDEIRAIRERVQKREIMATLQVYAARPVMARAITD